MLCFHMIHHILPLLRCVVTFCTLKPSINLIIEPFDQMVQLQELLPVAFVSISSACTLDRKASVGVDHSAAVVVATVAVLPIVVRLVSIRVVLQGNLLLALLPSCGVLLLLRNHFSRRGDRL